MDEQHVTRDFTVAVFIVHNNRVLLFYHKKHRMWLPPGGHIEENELPDEAAVREVKEETGLEVILIGRRGLTVSNPKQLITPEGIQVERIDSATEKHEHIDLIYFAVPTMDFARVRQENEDERERLNSEVPALERIIFSEEEAEEGGWFGQDALNRMNLADDVRLWSLKALDETPKRLSAGWEL